MLPLANSSLVGAHDAYEEAIKLEPNNEQFKSSFESVKRAINAEAQADGVTGDPTAGLGNMFNDPQLIAKLATNPKTSHLLADSDFMAKLQRIRTNPNEIGKELGDPRLLQVVGVLLGIDMQFGGPPGAGADGPSASTATEVEEDVPMQDHSTWRPQDAPKEPAPEYEDEESIQRKKAQEAGDAEKKIGNDLYKKRQFDEAVEHYSKAWELNKDITYLNNIAAAKFEKGDYKGAIETCEEAIKEGREQRADFKVLAK
jgi:stress-induced-phosphoprotein 1